MNIHPRQLWPCRMDLIPADSPETPCSRWGLNIETPLKQFVVAHGNLVRHCGAIHDAVMAK